MTQIFIQITVNVRDGALCLPSFEGLFGGDICGKLIYGDFVALFVCLSGLVSFFGGGELSVKRIGVSAGALSQIITYFSKLYF